MKRDGFSLIDLILAIGIIVTLFGGIFLVYFSIVDTAVNYELRRAASGLLNQRIELVRNLPYEQVGVISGIPSGILPQTEPIAWDGSNFIVSSYVRSVDDPFDGTAESTPRDSAPADYKLVEFTVSCPTCSRFTPVSITTTVAPRGLESASQNGSLFVEVFDAEGLPVQGATVSIANASTTPQISFTDVTDDNGRLQLVDVPTSTIAYRVSVTKSGYSSEQTYQPGDVANLNPVKPHATVSSQTVTELSFAIDRLGSVPVSSTGYRCEPDGGAPFTLTSSKLIGTGPDIRKRIFTGTTDTGGVSTMPLAEWDSYEVAYGGSKDLAGTVPLAPLSVAPGANQQLRLILMGADRPALLVAVRDGSTGAPVSASVTLDGPGADRTGTTSEADYLATDWTAPGAYSAASGIDTYPGGFSLSPSSGPYPVGTVATLESGTIDLGGTPAGALSIRWNDTVSGAGADAVRFQVAGSDSDGNWNFVGPDGTGGSYFTGAGSVAGSAAGKRYVRYKAYLQTQSALTAPSVEDVTLGFTGPCVPPGQRLFQGLATGSYSVSASASGYDPGSVSTSVGSGWQRVEILLSPS